MRKSAFAIAVITASGLLRCNYVLENEQGYLAQTEDASRRDATSDMSSPETQGEASGVSEGGCAPGQKTCSAQCVDSSDPIFGCNDPACNPCALSHATALCGGGHCGINTCDPGYADCDGNPASGCETDLSLASHCGSCNSVCPATAPVCVPAGSGSFNCATSCTPSAPVLCGTQCVDVTTSPTHCGGCNTVCPAVTNGQTTCIAGLCGINCNTDFHACGSSCSSNESPSSCGSSCVACAVPTNSTATCSGGSCGFACNSGFHLCGGACADISDTATCGASCTPCPGGPNSTTTCDGTTCSLACATGFADCDGNPATGCEVNLTDDPKNCGTCAHACPTGDTCMASACVAPPPLDAGAKG